MTVSVTASDRKVALTEAYRTHRADLLAFAKRRLFGDAALAEEGVQDTFLRAWRSLDRFDPTVATMRMWLFAICRNATADIAHARVRHERGDTAAAAERDTDTAAEASIERLAASTRLQQALLALPSWQRVAVIEVHLRERSYAEVARDLHVPVGTVKSRVHLGLRTARAALATTPVGTAA